MGNCRGSLHLSAITITPTSAQLDSGASQQFFAQGLNCDGTLNDSVTVTWSAEGGTIDSGGNYTAGAVGGTYLVKATSTMAGPLFVAQVPVTINAPTPTVSSVTISPSSPSVIAGRQLQFAATVHMSDGTTIPFTGTWSTTSGSITSGGLLTAGSSPGAYQVSATQSSVTGTVVLQVTAAPTLTSVTVSPSTVTLTSGQTQQYAATGTLSDGTTTSVAVTWSKTGASNTISTGGLFTAGSSAGSFTVTATAVGTAISGNGSVTVSVANPSAPTAVIKNPPNGFVYVSGTTTTLDPTGSFSQGTNNPWNAHWVIKDGSGNIKLDVTGTSGTLAGNMFPFNPGSTGTRNVYLTVIDSFGTTSPTVVVSGTIVASSATLQSITVSPTPVTVLPGATQQFTATGHFSDGSAKSVPVTWTATGGTITTGGLYTAGATAGTYTVTATSV